MSYKLAFIGFGVVGQGFAQLLEEKKDLLRTGFGLEYTVTAISDPAKGSVYQEEGLNLKEILSLLEKDGYLKGYGSGVKGWDSLRTINDADADVIVEVSPTNIDNGEPGISHIRSALGKKKHVITTNKGPIALYYRELAELARRNGVALKFEGTVLSGTPAINLSLDTLAGAVVHEIKGIMNGTTNYMLTKMAEGQSYETVLKEAQRLGYAETKPDADVKGWDAQAKIVIMANVVMGGDLKPKDVPTKGITEITLDDIEKARTDGKRFKLIGHAWKEGGEVKAKVSPVLVGADDFLYHVNGVTNALTFVTDALSKVTIVGPGAGRLETGFSLLVDLLGLHRAFSGQ
ncbi:MAG: homoserine dehydrogenase [candidate division WOR-3 bacterium]|nr:MAG: homoserine dehydrogenase [candidate division WOR-3 bacterium]